MASPRESRAARSALQKGALLLKHCRRAKPHAVFVQLSPLENELQWVSAAGKLRTLPFSTVLHIVTGQTTPVFRRSPGMRSDATSFSVIYRENSTERSLDLVCKNTEQMQLWLHGLQAFIELRRDAQLPLRAGKASLVSAPAGNPTSRSLMPWPRELLFWGRHGSKQTDQVAVSGPLSAPRPGVEVSMLTGVKELVPVVLRRADALDVADVSFSTSHGALLSSDGGLFTWGAASRYGELGHSSLQSISTPLRVESLFNVTVASISCGTARSAAVTEEGELFVVGDASALRDASQWVPRSVRIPGAKVRQVSCGPFHSALITVDGALYTWGEGAFGALGHGDFLPQHAPRRVEALSGYRMQQVSCGVWHTAATGFSCEGGEAKLVRLFTWGDGDAGQLGNGAKTAAPLPYAVGGALGGHSVKQVVCGARHTLALTELGAVFGSGHQGAGAPRATFAQLKGALAGKSVQQIACGDKHSLALLQGGRSVFSWGCGAGGRLGHGDEKDRETPTLVAALSKRDVRTVVCGPECSSAVCEAVRLSVEEKAALARSEDEAGWVVAMHPSRRASSVRPRRSLVAPDGEGDSSERLAPRSVRSASLPADGGARRGSLGEWSQVAILSAELSSARHEVSALRAELAELRTKVIN